MKYGIEYMALSEVVRWPRNPRRHDDENIDASIERFGFTAPLMMDERTQRLVAGHGRLEALQRRHAAKKGAPKGIDVRPDGEWMVPVVRGVTFASDAEAEAYLIADNRLTEKGGWDKEVLGEMLRGLALKPEDYASIGYDKAALSAAVKPPRAASGKTPEDLREGFENASEKQVVLYFEAKTYDAFMLLWGETLKKSKATSGGELLEKLLDGYEAAHANA